MGGEEGTLAHGCLLRVRYEIDIEGEKGWEYHKKVGGGEGGKHEQCSSM